jgi:hypothetical protein
MIMWTLYHLEDKTILWNGMCPDENCLPFKPEGYEFAFGIMGNPETEKIQVDIVDGNKVYSLVPFVRPRNREELIAAVERERVRRLAAGFDYDFGDERGVHRIGTTEEDRKGWADVNIAAFKAVARGQGQKILHIFTNSGPVDVTADEWLAILDADEAFRQPIWQMSFALQAMEPIPQDIENQEYWT